MRRRLGVLSLVVVLALGLTGCLLQEVAENLDPIAAITYTVTNGIYTFSAAESIDPDGTVDEYIWYFGDGVSRLGVTSPHQYAEPGSYLVTLVIFDNDGASDDATAWVNVRITVPVVPINPANAIIIVSGDMQTGSEVAFSGLTSVGRDNAAIMQGVWTFGDGETVAGDWYALYSTNNVGEIVHIYDDIGSYLVTLVIIDKNGFMATTSITVTIE